MVIDIEKIYECGYFKIIDKQKNLFFADPFIYKIFPEDYPKITSLLIEDPNTFSEVNKIQKTLESLKDQTAEELRQNLFNNSLNLKVLNQFKFSDNTKDDVLRKINLIKNYKSFFKEVGTSLKFNPLSSREAALQIRTSIYELLKRYLPIIKPKVLFKVAEAKIESDSLIIDNCSFKFHSKNLAEFYSEYNSEVRNIIIYVVTISNFIDYEVRRLSKSGEIFNAYILNGIGSGAVEMVAKDLNLFMNDFFCPHDNSINFKRFSPGYGDWNIEDQKIIFNILEPEKNIGINLTENFLMIPEKSTSGIMGLTQKFKL